MRLNTANARNTMKEIITNNGEIYWLANDNRKYDLDGNLIPISHKIGGKNNGKSKETS